MSRNWELQKNIDGRVWHTVGWNLSEDQAKSMAENRDDYRAIKAE